MVTSSKYRKEAVSYRDALNRLLALWDYERYAGQRGPRTKFSLDRMSLLLQSLRNPHLTARSVHVAGTKGKGSTTAMIASVLTSQGYLTGMFTSPHLHTFRERISIDRTPITEGDFCLLVDELWPHLEQVSKDSKEGSPSLFEALTAMAFLHFRNAKADFQVVEVGLGGRLDSTNLVHPQVSVLTPISLDHTAILGNSVEVIAKEKAGIVKPGVPVVSAPQVYAAENVIHKTCEDTGAPLIRVGTDVKWKIKESDSESQSFEIHGRFAAHQLHMGLLGDYQIENAATAVGALECLTEQGWNISDRAVSDGFRKVKWPCRLEVLQDHPLLIVDGAHNPSSVSRLCNALPKSFGFRRVVLICGVSKDKNLDSIVEQLARLNPAVVTTTSRHPRSAPAPLLSKMFAHKDINVWETGDVPEAVRTAKKIAQPQDVILATGSLFLAAEVREVILGLEPEYYPEPDLLPDFHKKVSDE